MSMKRFGMIAGAAALAFAATHSSAAEYVINGGFETGDLTGWTEAGNYGTSYNHIDTSIGPPHSGAYDMVDGSFASQGLGGLSQVLGTTAGQNYEISLWWKVTGGNDSTGQDYQVVWNNTVVGEINGSPATGWTHLTYDVVGAGSDTLTFWGYSNSGYNATDDVSVTNIAGVPEPGTWALMIGGLGLTGALLRRRRALALA